MLNPERIIYILENWDYYPDKIEDEELRLEALKIQKSYREAKSSMSFQEARTKAQAEWLKELLSKNNCPRSCSTPYQKEQCTSSWCRL